MMTAMSRERAVDALGEDAIRQFDEQGYVLVVARNGHSYYIFQPIPSRQIGQHGASLDVMSWCVFGVDPRADEDPEGFRYPREHFFAYDSQWDPVYQQLLSIWYALKNDPRPFLLDGCEPLFIACDHKRAATSKMLRKIGKKCGKDEYYAAGDRSSAFRNASSSRGSASARKQVSFIAVPPYAIAGWRKDLRAPSSSSSTMWV